MKTYHFHAYKWDSTPHFYKWDSEHKYKTFNIIAEKKFRTEAETMHEAIKRFVFAFPDWSIGFGCHCDNGDFCCTVVKDYYFYDGKNPTDAEIIKEIQQDWSKRK